MSEILMPHNEAAERCLIASCLVFPEKALADAQKWVDGGSFYLAKHRAIWLALDEYYRASNPPDIHLFVDFLIRRSLLEECGGFEYLSEIVASDSWEWANSGWYGKCVAQHAERRGYIAAGSSIMREALDGNPETDIAAKATELLRGIEKRGQEDPAGMHEGLPDFADMDPEKVFGIAVMSGISGLDLQVRMGGEKYIIIGARPGHGKTALAMTIAVNAAMQQKLRVLFYSFEQKPLELKINALSQISGIAAEKIHAGKCTPPEAMILNGCKPGLSNMPLEFIYAKGWGLGRLMSDADSRSLTRKVNLVVVDHIGLIDPGDGKGARSENRQQQVAGFSLGMKALTGRLRCPALVLCQLNRSPDKEKEKRKPQMSDLRDSGALEQDADVILFPYRPQANGSKSEAENDAEIIVAKNKNAKPGLVPVIYYPKTMKFEGRGF